MEIIKKIQQFFSYWYVRYLLVTELYMVDTWEKIVVQDTATKNEEETRVSSARYILFGVIFTMFWYFNYSIIVSGISSLRSSTTHDIEQIL